MDPTDDPLATPELGHRKAIAVPLVAAPVSVGTWWLQYHYGVEIPGHVVADVLAFITTLAVYCVHHSKPPKGQQ